MSIAARWLESNRAKSERARRRRGIQPRQPSGRRHVGMRAQGWLAIDGEGWGTDAQGRQCYKLMTAADDEGFEDALYATGERLQTAEILEWLCFLPFRHGRRRQALGLPLARPRLCGFGLGYDYAHILLDLSLEQLQELFHNQDPESAWVRFEGPEAMYDLKLTAGRLQVKRKTRGMQTGFANIWDTFRYFQSSFMVAANQVMTPEERTLIEAGKGRRGEVVNDMAQEAEYALAECKVLSRLMGTLEEQTRSLDLSPSSWYGPGSLATLALKKEGVGASYRADSELDSELVSAAAKAFVGGRFETTGHGRLPHLFEYDIRSAYPHAITKLPCLAHTSWEHVVSPSLEQCRTEWALVHVAWKIPSPAGGWGPWPSRVQMASPSMIADAGKTYEELSEELERSSIPDDWEALRKAILGMGGINGLGDYKAEDIPGNLHKRKGVPYDLLPRRMAAAGFPDLIHLNFEELLEYLRSQHKQHQLPKRKIDESQPHSYLPVWPWSGRAHIWGPEFRAGLDLLRRSTGWQIHLDEAWIPTQHCDCEPFRWVADWYETRKTLVAQGDPKEKWIKLILNSLYGKMAQQVGKPQWHSWLWSGMITAHTRSQLLTAIAQDPEAVVMTATDAVYAVRPLEMPIGESLGAWEIKSLGDALIVQSGFFKAHQMLSSDKPRTRGIPRRYIDWDRFEVMWDEIQHGLAEWNTAKIVVDSDPLTGDKFQIHVGIGLAQLWGKTDKLGAWLDYPTEVTFSTDKRPLLWPGGPKRGDWLSTKPWALPANEGIEYRAGRGIGEDRFLVMDQPDAQMWGEM